MRTTALFVALVAVFGWGCGGGGGGSGGQTVFTLTIDIVPAGAGSVSVSPGKAAYAKGERVTLTPTATGSYGFAHWEGDGKGLANPAVVDIVRDTKVTAVFGTEHTVGPGGSYDFTSIQSAIDTLTDGDIIVVHPDTYNEDVDFKGKALTVRSTAPFTASTVIATIINGTVFFRSMETEDSVVAGFTIKDSAECLNGSSPVIQANDIAGPGAVGFGVFCMNNSSPWILDNTISGWTAGTGSGVYCLNFCDAHIEGNDIFSNYYGVWCDNSDAVLRNNVVETSSAHGIMVESGGTVLAENNTISLNKGCGVLGNLARLTLRRNIIGANGTWASSTSGVNCVQCDLTLENNLIVGNQGTAGGGLSCQDVYHGEVSNNTFHTNRATNGGAIYLVSSSVSFSNCIFWNDQATIGPEVWAGNSIVAVGYSDVSGGIGGIYNSGGQVRYDSTNFNLDPLFALPGYWDLNGTPANYTDDVWVNGDYHLKSQRGRWSDLLSNWLVDTVTSPCIDAGDPASDYGLEPLPNGGRINVGAYGGIETASKTP